MNNNFKTTINWQNADIYSPEQKDEPIIYCTANNKIGVFKEVKEHWPWLKKKYNIKWWCYQYYVIPIEKMD